MKFYEQNFDKLVVSFIYVTWHEKIELMYTKYITSYYSTYLAFCVSYTSSVNCVEFPIVCCTSLKSFIDNMCLGAKL